MRTTIIGKPRGNSSYRPLFDAATFDRSAPVVSFVFSLFIVH